MSELGEVLKNTREEKSISLEELQSTTKIQKRYLRAIEKGEYGQLPGQFYARAFIKSYAEAVGLDSDRLFEEHSEEIPGQNRELPDKLPSRSGGERPQHSRRSKLSNFFPKLLVWVAVIGIVAVIYAVFLHLSDGTNAGSDNDVGSSVEQSENAGISNENKGTENDGKDPSTEQPSENQSSEGSGQTQEPEQKPGSKPKQKLLKTGSQGNIVHYTLKNAEKFELKLAIDDSKSWIEVRRSGADGKKYEYDMFKPGQTITRDLSKNKNIFLNIGSTPSVTISINGKPFKYPNDNTTQRFLITYQKGS